MHHKTDFYFFSYPTELISYEHILLICNLTKKKHCLTSHKVHVKNNKFLRIHSYTGFIPYKSISNLFSLNLHIQVGYTKSETSQIYSLWEMDRHTLHSWSFACPLLQKRIKLNNHVQVLAHIFYIAQVSSHINIISHKSYLTQV